MKTKTYLALLSSLIVFNASIVTITLNVIAIDSYTIIPFGFGVIVMIILTTLLVIKLTDYYKANKVVSNKVRESNESYVLRQFSVL